MELLLGRFWIHIDKQHFLDTVGERTFYISKRRWWLFSDTLTSEPLLLCLQNTLGFTTPGGCKARTKLVFVPFTWEHLYFLDVVAHVSKVSTWNAEAIRTQVWTMTLTEKQRNKLNNKKRLTTRLCPILKLRDHYQMSCVAIKTKHLASKDVKVAAVETCWQEMIPDWWGSERASSSNAFI